MAILKQFMSDSWMICKWFLTDSQMILKCLVILGGSRMIFEWCSVMLKWFLNDSQVIPNNSWMIPERFWNDCEWFLGIPGISCWFPNLILKWFSNDSQVILKWFLVILKLFLNDSWWFSNNSWAILEWFLRGLAPLYCHKWVWCPLWPYKKINLSIFAHTVISFHTDINIKEKEKY